uniref:L1 transposable element RRM domain-containing protein n=1 Tax=Labrus bergylta TaxID=56723 RepID=A0A3Q3MQ47_9LABR
HTLSTHARQQTLAGQLESRSTGEQVNELEHRVSSNEDDITDLARRVKVLEKENTDLKAWVEDAENRSRRSNLRFIGIPERAEGNNILGFMSRLIPQGSQADLGKAPLLPGQDEDNETLQEKKEPPQYKGARVYIYPDFSAGLIQRRRGFDALKKKLRDRDIKYALIFPCTLRVVRAGKTLFLRTPDEAETFLVNFPPLIPPLTLT